MVASERKRGHKIESDVGDVMPVCLRQVAAIAVRRFQPKGHERQYRPRYRHRSERRLPGPGQQRAYQSAGPATDGNSARRGAQAGSMHRCVMGCEFTPSLPPDHRPFRCSANDGATALYAIGRWNGNHPNAARVDGQVVMKRRLIEVAMYRAEIGEVGTTTS